VYQSAKYCVIERINFVTKFYVVLMTFYGNRVVKSNNLSQGRISIPQGTVELSSTIFAKYKTGQLKMC